MTAAVKITAARWTATRAGTVFGRAGCPYPWSISSTSARSVILPVQYRMRFVESRSKALWYALTSAFAFAVMGLFVKLASDVDVLDKVVFRNLVSLVIALGIVLRQPPPVNRKRVDNQLALMARSLFGIGGVICYLLGHRSPPSGRCHHAGQTVTVLCRHFRRRVSPRTSHCPHHRALILGFAGGLLVIKPLRSRGPARRSSARRRQYLPEPPMSCSGSSETARRPRPSFSTFPSSAWSASCPSCSPTSADRLPRSGSGCWASG